MSYSHREVDFSRVRNPVLLFQILFKLILPGPGFKPVTSRIAGRQYFKLSFQWDWRISKETWTVSVLEALLGQYEVLSKFLWKASSQFYLWKPWVLQIVLHGIFFIFVSFMWKFNKDKISILSIVDNHLQDQITIHYLLPIFHSWQYENDIFTLDFSVEDC